MLFGLARLMTQATCPFWLAAKRKRAGTDAAAGPPPSIAEWSAPPRQGLITGLPTH